MHQTGDIAPCGIHMLGECTCQGNSTWAPLGIQSFDIAHVHKWQAAGIERRFINRPTNVIQSCECGEARRVEVPE